MIDQLFDRVTDSALAAALAATLPGCPYCRAPVARLRLGLVATLVGIRHAAECPWARTEAPS